MKTKNMRKKALLSSVAMLLVAVVALGGATYAWFSTNESADAKGVSLASGQETSLLFGSSTAVASNEGDWAASYSLPTTDVSVVPMSSIDGTSFKKIEIGTSGNTEQLTKVKKLANVQSSDYFSHTFKAKSTVESCLKLKTIGWTSESPVNDLKDVTRISIKVGAGAAKIFYLTDTAPTNCAIAAAESGTYAEDSKTFAEFYALPTSLDSTNGVDIAGIQKAKPTYAVAGQDSAIFTETPFTANGTLDITINIWIEGNDSYCNNSMMNCALSGLVFTFETAQAPNSGSGSGGSGS